MQDFELRHRLMHESLVHLVPISEYMQSGAGLISYDCFISFLHVFFQQHFRFQQHHVEIVEAKLPSWTGMVTHWQWYGRKNWSPFHDPRVWCLRGGCAQIYPGKKSWGQVFFAINVHSQKRAQPPGVHGTQKNYPESNLGTLRGCPWIKFIRTR